MIFYLLIRELFKLKTKHYFLGFHDCKQDPPLKIFQSIDDLIEIIKNGL